jgi:hypothetical protein
MMLVSEAKGMELAMGNARWPDIRAYITTVTSRMLSMVLAMEAIAPDHAMGLFDEMMAAMQAIAKDRKQIDKVSEIRSDTGTVATQPTITKKKETARE